MVTVLRAADHRRTRWKNGGGSTLEVLGHPAGAGLEDFDWRISIAEVEVPGPFSTFDCVDRTIILLDGVSMRLTVDGVGHDLVRYESFAFDGDASTSCAIPGGPTRDLNVMTRRGRAQAVTEVLQPTAPVSLSGAGAGDGDVVIVVLRGSIVVTALGGATYQLTYLDGLRADQAATVTVHGDGVLAVIRLRECRGVDDKV